MLPSVLETPSVGFQHVHLCPVSSFSPTSFFPPPPARTVSVGPLWIWFVGFDGSLDTKGTSWAIVPVFFSFSFFNFTHLFPIGLRTFSYFCPGHANFSGIFQPVSDSSPPFFSVSQIQSFLDFPPPPPSNLHMNLRGHVTGHYYDPPSPPSLGIFMTISLPLQNTRVTNTVSIVRKRESLFPPGTGCPPPLGSFMLNS